MRICKVLIILFPFYFWGCGVEERKEDKKELEPKQLESEPVQNDVLDDRFLSKDRELYTFF